MKVLKFGGTSVGNPQMMKNVANIIKSKEKTIVVLSAVSGTTDALLKIARNIQNSEIVIAGIEIEKLENFYLHFIIELFNDKENYLEAMKIVDEYFVSLNKYLSLKISQIHINEILTFGELLSTKLFGKYLSSIGVDNELLFALDFMKLKSNGEPDFNFISEELNKILNSFSESKLFVTQGYICRNSFGETDNLKRGGSDFSATIIGNVVNASQVQIWTDIDGVHNNDPRYVENTETIKELSYSEAAELAYFGAKILHPTCVHPVQAKKIPLILKNTMNPSSKGTTIFSEVRTDKIKAVAAKDGITVIKIRSAGMLNAYGFLRKVFEIFENYKVPVDMITTSEVSVSLTIDNSSDLLNIVADLMKFGHVEYEQNQSIICVVGDFLATNRGYIAKVSQAVKDIPIRMVSYGGSDNNISLVVCSKNKIQALNSLHEKLFGNNSVVGIESFQLSEVQAN